MDSVGLSLLPVLVSTVLFVTLLSVVMVRQRRIQNALRLSEEKFSKAVGFSPDAVTISHVSDGRFIEVNDSFCHLTGYSRQEALGRTSIELGLWDPNARQALLQSLKASGSVRNQEIPFRRKDGQIIHTLLSTAVFQLDRQPCLLTVARDITEWKQAQTRLQRLAERDRLIAETAMRIRQASDLDSILEAAVTEVRQFLAVDRAFIHRIHQGSSTIVAESRSDTAASLLGQGANIPTQAIRQRMEQTSVAQVEDVEALEGDCPYRNFVRQYGTRAAMGAAILVEGELFGVLVVHQCHRPRQWQAYESKLLEQVSTQMAIAIQQATLLQRIRDANTNLGQQVAERTAEVHQQMQELQERNRLLNFSLHAISHDLRTSAMGNLMTLQSMASPTQKSVTISGNVLQRMRQGAERQLHKLESLQDIYTAKTVGLDLNPEAVTLAALVKQVACDLAPLIAENQVQLAVSLLEELPKLWVDPGYIRQVLQQLITNAIVHNAPGISITVSGEPLGDRVCCRIEDTGRGIAPALQGRLFELCTDSSEVRHYGSISLGLYRCRQIVEAHGGMIAATGQNGSGVASSGVASSDVASSGVTIEFTLPALPPPASGSQTGLE